MAAHCCCAKHTERGAVWRKTESLDWAELIRLEFKIAKEEEMHTMPLSGAGRSSDWGQMPTRD